MTPRKKKTKPFWWHDFERALRRTPRAGFDAGLDAAHWRANITANPKVLGGKPVVKDTRIAVDFILELYANGWTDREILANYPGLTVDDLHACHGFARDVLRLVHSQLAQVALDPNSTAEDEKLLGLELSRGLAQHDAGLGVPAEVVLKELDAIATGKGREKDPYQWSFSEETWARYEKELGRGRKSVKQRTRPGSSPKSEKPGAGGD